MSIYNEAVDKPSEGAVVAPVQNDEATDTTKSPEPTPTINVPEGNAKITLHHLNNSRSQRILWLLEELEIPYEVKSYEESPGAFRRLKPLRGVHPLGKAPVITDGDVTLAESSAIVEYLICKYGAKFRPSESGKLDDLYFSHYAEGSFMPLVVNKLIFAIIPQRSPALIRPLLKFVFKKVDKTALDPDLKAHCAMIDEHLNKCETGWIAGGNHPTSADFMMGFALDVLIHRVKGFVVGPKIKEYVTRIQERPAYKRGLEKGGDTIA